MAWQGNARQTTLFCHLSVCLLGQASHTSHSRLLYMSYMHRCLLRLWVADWEQWGTRLPVFTTIRQTKTCVCVSLVSLHPSNTFSRGLKQKSSQLIPWFSLTWIVRATLKNKHRDWKDDMPLSRCASLVHLDFVGDKGWSWGRQVSRMKNFDSKFVFQCW